MTEPSSRDLHPTTGARFAFDRVDGEPEPVYDLVIYLPEARRWAGRLRWRDGRAELEAAAAQPDAPDASDHSAATAEELAWAEAEALKLARVLHRDPRPHMLRWRG